MSENAGGLVENTGIDPARIALADTVTRSADAGWAVMKLEATVTGSARGADPAP